MFYAQLGIPLSISFTFILLTWQGLGGGFTANAWQSLIAKVFPPHQRGTFLGLQAAMANITIAIGAVIAGQVLERLKYPTNYAVCFVIACIWFTLSWLALAQVREEESFEDGQVKIPHDLLKHIREIWKSNHNFRLFLIARNFTQFTTMGFAFYIIYSVRHFEISEGIAGLLSNPGYQPDFC